MSKTKFLERFENTGLDVPNHVWDTMIDHDIANGRIDVLSNNRINNVHITSALNSNNQNMRRDVFYTRQATPHHIDVGLSDPNPTVRRAAAYHPNITPEQLYRASHDKNARVREAAIRNISTNHKTDLTILNKMADDSDMFVRYAVVHHPNTTKDILEKLVNDSNSGVRGVAKTRLVNNDYSM